MLLLLLTMMMMMMLLLQAEFLVDVVKRQLKKNR